MDASLPCFGARPLTLHIGYLTVCSLDGQTDIDVMQLGLLAVTRRALDHVPYPLGIISQEIVFRIQLQSRVIVLKTWKHRFNGHFPRSKSAVVAS